jgi:hypothetical protein
MLKKACLSRMKHIRSGTQNGLGMLDYEAQSYVGYFDHKGNLNVSVGFSVVY